MIQKQKENVAQRSENITQESKDTVSSLENVELSSCSEITAEENVVDDNAYSESFEFVGRARFRKF